MNQRDELPAGEREPRSEKPSHEPAPDDPREHQPIEDPPADPNEPNKRMQDRHAKYRDRPTDDGMHGDGADASKEGFPDDTDRTVLKQR
jgi:hypothetical protein